MRARGFTVVEFVFVLAIAALILAMTMPFVNRYIERAKVTRAVADLAEMSKAIRAFDKRTGGLPASLSTVTDDSGANLGYGTRVDPWGYPYQYYDLPHARGNGIARKDKILKPLNSDFDLYSIGPDGQTSASLAADVSRDDIVRARDGGFVGPAWEFDP
jgi:general secretion pathway protein G